LIEDYLPIEAISAEASREKSVRKGHISTLHLWWARRPLVACRAAVYGALVPADRLVKDVELKAAPADAAKAEKVKNGKKKGLNRKAAKEFVTKLCRYPKTNPTKEEDVRVKRETEAAVVEAQRHILEAHVDRLTAELAEAKKTGNPPPWVDEFKFTGERVTYDDIVAGRAPRPRVLDMFAGGGAIPLEALRLGCEAYALDLNPVAHIIQLCTLVYPQKYGKPDPNARGMAGPKNAQGETTWGGLADEVRYWGNWVLERLRKEIGDLYPPIPDPNVWSTPSDVAFDQETGQWNVIKEGQLKRGVRLEQPSVARTLLTDDGHDEEEEEATSDNRVSALPPGYLQPVAYLWTRTVRCKNPGCAAIVPLVRQTWLCKKAKRYVALRMVLRKPEKRVAFQAVESQKEGQLGFDPNGFSSGGNATCPFCGTVADVDFVKAEGMAGRIGQQLMGVTCLPRRGTQGKVYFGDDDVIEPLARGDAAKAAIDRLTKNVTPPDEPLPPYGTLGFRVQPYGHTKWESLFAPRQLAAMLSLVNSVQATHDGATADERGLAVRSQLACYVDRAADHWSMLCAWNPSGEKVQHTFGRQALPMVWDFAEASPFGTSVGDWWGFVLNGENAIEAGIRSGDRAAQVMRGSAMSLPVENELLDALVTDPPYYDNVPYADLSDFFYVWLRRSIGKQYPEHFSATLTPKKAEAIAEAMRHQRNQDAANRAYEAMLAESFRAGNRALKRNGTAVVVYAHKTTLGWATLVDALRRSGFVVTEAWPLDTENKTRLRGMDSANAGNDFTQLV
jgi:putative DNA methylase